MTDTKELVKRLRANTEKYPGFQNMNTEAADTIERLERELAEAKETIGRWEEITRDELAETLRLMEALGVVAQVQSGKACMAVMLCEIDRLKSRTQSAEGVVEKAEVELAAAPFWLTKERTDRIRAALTAHRAKFPKEAR